MVKYNGVLYTYVHNLQGDIVGIVDASGNLVVEYKYDAWGRKVSVSGSQASSLGTLNPFRYRGYVYDEESGMYYLRSRYYNPNKVRFFNADSELGNIGGIGAHNLYTYCLNAPMIYADPDGNAATTLGLLVGLAIAAVTAAPLVYVASKSVKKAQEVNNASSKHVINTKQLFKSMFCPVPKNILEDIYDHVGGWYYRSKILFSYMERANYYVVYSLSPTGSVIRWDYAYEVHRLDKSTLPLFSFLDSLQNFMADPTMTLPFLSADQNAWLAVMLYVWGIVSNAELPPSLEIQNRVVVFESNADRAYREGFRGLF